MTEDERGVLRAKARRLVDAAVALKLRIPPEGHASAQSVIDKAIALWDELAPPTRILVFDEA